LLVLVAAGVCALVYFVYDAVLATNASSSDHILIIPPNSSASVITDSLHKSGTIRNVLEFRIALKILGKENALLPGIYEFKSHISNMDIINALCHSNSAHHIYVTFPEGLTSFEIAHIAQEHLHTDSTRFVALTRDSAFIRSLGIKAPSLEGYLFPETYEFDLPVTERSVLARMVFAMKHELSDSIQRRCVVLGISIEQMLAIASIVEAEAATESERPRIAGVYWNRLHSGMRLEADPTVQYAIGEKRHLYYKDLAIESPYNTYLHVGLPPTPINNPGSASVSAALYPEKNSFLYFVARGDSSRQHRFSENLQGQNIAVGIYRQNRNKKK